MQFERNWFKFAKKPNITYYYKEKKEYILIDVTIVCDENINVAFARKAAKYNPLQQALIATLKAKSTKMIPVVLSISGLLNKKSKEELDRVGIRLQWSKILRTIVLHNVNDLISYFSHQAPIIDPVSDNNENDVEDSDKERIGNLDTTEPHSNDSEGIDSNTSH